MKKILRHLASVAVLGMCVAAEASAQTIEIVPLGGYRFGGSFFERTVNRPVDTDGAPAIGGAVNVALGDGLWFEALFTRQQARVTGDDDGDSSPTPWRIYVEHWQAGGLQEFGSGRARPFLTGLLGLTRFADEGEDEIRFTVEAGGGIKLLLGRGLGIRVDTRLFSTLVDGDARAVACGPGLCLVRVNVDILWQLELSAGLVVRF